MYTEFLECQEFTFLHKLCVPGLPPLWLVHTIRVTLQHKSKHKRAYGTYMYIHTSYFSKRSLISTGIIPATVPQSTVATVILQPMSTTQSTSTTMIPQSTSTPQPMSTTAILQPTSTTAFPQPTSTTAILQPTSTTAILQPMLSTATSRSMLTTMVPQSALTVVPSSVAFHSKTHGKLFVKDVFMQ